MIQNNTETGASPRGMTSKYLLSGVLGSLSAVLMMGTALAGPLGGVVVDGSASIAGQGSANVVINQSSSRVIIDWSSFDTGVHDQVTFNQGGANNIALNRITNGSPTNFLGSLKSDGKVIVMNPNGVIFGAGASVDVGALVATSANLSNSSFMNDANPVFSMAGNPNAKIINNGTITAKQAGLVGLVAPHVENNGLIQVNLGKVQLHSGSTFTLDLAGDALVNIAIADDVAEQFLKNAGTVKGGSIVMTAAAVRYAVDNLVVNSGTIEATTASVQGGKIILGGPDAYTIQEGTLKANGASGGDITVTGHSIITNGLIEARGTVNAGGTVKLLSDTSLESMSGTTIDVSGATGGSIIMNAKGSVSSGTYKANGTNGHGGSIDWGGNISLLSATLEANGTNGGAMHLGGLWQNPSASGWDVNGLHLDPSTNIVVSTGSTLTAKATQNGGSGGEIVLRAQDKTLFGGSINTQGKTIGQGGKAEVSGHTIQLLSGNNVTTGTATNPGTYLLDPQNITIGAASSIDATSLVKLAFNYSLAAGDWFGGNLALNGVGNILAVGARQADIGGTDRGAVYIFSLDPNDPTYAPAFKQRIAHGTSGISLANGDQFGTGLAFNTAGNLLAVGAHVDDTGGTDRGAVYLLGLNTSNLSTAPTYYRKLAHGVDGITLANSDNFGTRIALNDTGSIMAVSAYLDDTGGADRGAVYIFNLDTGNFANASILRQKIAHGTSGMSLANSDGFGIGLALNNAGNILASGAYLDDTGGTDRGAVYLFNLDPNNLATTAVLRKKIAHGTSTLSLTNSDMVGVGVALNGAGDILSFGAYRDDTGGTDRGAAFLFNLDTNDLTATPTLRKKIAHGTSGLSLVNSDLFGTVMAMNDSGSMLIVSSLTDDTSGADTGALYFFGLNTADLTTNPVLKNKIHGSNPGLNLTAGDNFGISTSLNSIGNILAIGAYQDDTGGANRGSVYLFNIDPNDLSKSPIFRQKVTHGVGGLSLANNDAFGIDVALNDTGNIMAIGAYLDDTGGTDRGAAYLFTLDPSNLTTAPVLKKKISHGISGVTLANSDYFGVGLDLNGAGNLLAVGAYGTSSSAGAAFLFGLDVNDLTVNPTLYKKIQHGTSGLNLTGSAFGRDFAFNSLGNILVINAPGDSTGGAGRGAAYIFSLDLMSLTSDPTISYKLAHGSPGLSLADGDGFGLGVALNNDGTLLGVTAPSDDTGGTDRGAAYLFTLDPNNLTTAPAFKKKVTHGTSGLTLANTNAFGSSISFNSTGKVAIIGTRYDDTGGADAGGAYLLDVAGLLTGTNQIYSYLPSSSVNFTPEMLAALLNGGNNVTLQASNDITVNSALLVNNPSGNGGTLTLQAGRSVVFNANVTTDNGNLVVIANDTAASGVVDAYRLAGMGGITMASGVTINAGTGDVSFIVRDGAGVTNAQSGHIDLRSVTAGSILAETAENIILNSQISGSDAGNAIILSGKNFVNNFGATALNTSTGRALVYSLSPLSNTMGSITGHTKRYNSSYAGYGPGSVAAGAADVFLYTLAPTITVTADNATRVYGDANPGFTYSSSGYVDGDTSAILTGSPSLTTAANNATNVGSATITAAAGTLDNPYNYAFAYVDGTLSITKAMLTATVQNTTRIYGDADPTFSINYTGFKNSQNSGVIDTLATASSNATITSGVGNGYTVTASGAADTNYDFTYVAGTMSITKAMLTATVQNASREYSEANPAFSIVYTGFKNSQNSGVIDTLATASSNATITSGVGNGYTVTASGAADTNYDFTYVNGTMSITKAMLTATVQNASREYSQANPAFSIVYTGFKNSETDSVIDTLAIADTVATPTSPIGAYAITASGAADDNYLFTYADGLLTVGAVGITNPQQLLWTPQDTGNQSTNGADSGFGYTDPEIFYDIALEETSYLSLIDPGTGSVPGEDVAPILSSGCLYHLKAFPGYGSLAAGGCK